MTKTELRKLIKEMLQEELKAVHLNEGSEKLPSVKNTPKLVRAGGYQAIAASIYNSDDFKKAFAADGREFGDSVDLLIKDIVSAKVNPDKIEEAAIKVRAYLRRYVSSTSKDHFDYSNPEDEIVSDIYSKYFDDLGNLY